MQSFILGISNVKSREDLVMSGSDSSDPFEKAPFKKPGITFYSSLEIRLWFKNFHLCYLLERGFNSSHILCF